MRRGMIILQAALCVSVVPSPAGLAGTTTPRPNFLLIITDDQRWDALGVVQHEQGNRARFPWLRTPNMDRLAREGIRFRNAFVVNSLCSPSRACYLTGKYNHHNGVANNHSPFPPNNVTFATLLCEAGYATGYIGKWHMDVQHGPRPGFAYSASLVGQGIYMNCPFEIDGIPRPTSGWVDDCATDFAIEFMENNRAKPFALVIGFKAVHGPFVPPDRAKDRFAGERAKPAVNQNVPAVYPDSMVTTYKKRIRTGKLGAPLFDGNVPYFRCLSAADDNLGRLLDALDRLGVADHTVVLLASDNGYQFVEHLLDDKRAAYEESIRIPMLIRYGKLGPKGKLVDEMVLNIDVAPTLLDVAGIPIPKDVQGRSLRPLIEGRPSSWRTSWFYEYFRETDFDTPTILAVRTASAKLVKYPGHDEWTELFDLADDRYETVNLAADPAHKALRAHMEAEFQKQKQAVGYEVPDYADPPHRTAKPPARGVGTPGAP